MSLILAKMRHILFGFFGVALIASGGYVLIDRAGPDYLRAIGSASWISTPGLIESQSLENVSLNGATQYFPNIQYSYYVEGKLFTGKRMNMGIAWSTNDVAIAKRILSKYRRGEKVAVYYNRDNPNESSLEIGLTTTNHILLAGCLLFLLLGFFLVGRAMKKIKDLQLAADEEKRDSLLSSTQTLAGVGMNPSRSQKAAPAIDIGAASRKKAQLAAKGKWYIVHDQKRYGPYAIAKIKSYVQDGRVNGKHLCVSVDGQIKISVSELLKSRKDKAS